MLYYMYGELLIRWHTIHCSAWVVREDNEFYNRSSESIALEGMK